MVYGNLANVGGDQVNNIDKWSQYFGISPTEMLMVVQEKDPAFEEMIKKFASIKPPFGDFKCTCAACCQK
jgi:hypothetical protein